MTGKNLGFVLSAAFLWLAWTAPAFADNFIDACDLDCRGGCLPGDTKCRKGEPLGNGEIGCILTDPNLVCSLGIGLHNGMDLDMHGLNYTCDPSGCTGEAIRITYFFSTISNQSSGESKIVGPWFPAIDCLDNVGSEVIGIKVEGTGYGINRCHRVLDNVVLGINAFLGYGILTDTSPFSSTVIQNNYVAGADFGIVAYGGTVSDNFVSTNDATAFGIWTLGTSALSVIDNVIMGDGFPGASNEVINADNTSTTFSGNICDNTHEDCAQCGQNGYCVENTAPFSP